MPRLNFFFFIISLRRNKKKKKKEKDTSSLINPIQLLPCGLPPTTCLDVLSRTQRAACEQAGHGEPGCPARAAGVPASAEGPLSASPRRAPRPPPPRLGAELPGRRLPGPFPTSGITCRRLACARVTVETGAAAPL